MAFAASLSSSASLAGLRLIRFTGPDVVTFLQGQLTQDLEQADASRTLLAACNTPQGRVVAVLRLRRTGSGMWALVASDLADTVAAHLRRYVLRAKVQIAVDPDALITASAATPESGLPAAAQAVADDAVVFEWARDRHVIARPSARPVAERTAVGPGDGDAAWSSWLAADIADGLPHVTGGTTGHFVAQMLNLDLLDAISFTKGCYTGQEIVARTQNLGRIKRRTLRYRVGSGEPPATLAAVERDGTKIGEVLQAARGPNGVELLAVVSLDARDRALALADGRALEPLPLPYDV
jgi:folate-binding protein YgfZ